MAPLTGAEKAAIEGFTRSKRGTRVLRPPVASALAAYFVNNGTTLPELPTARPSDPARLESWAAEWTDYAVAAGITDVLSTKESAVRLAVDAALTVLRVDQIIMSKKAGAGKK